MKKSIRILFLLVTVLALLSACSEAAPAEADTDADTEAAEAEAAPAAETYEIGLAAKNLSDPFTAWQAQLVIDKAEELYPEFDFTMIDCEGSTEKSISVMENLITQDVDIILWQNSDRDASVDVTNQSFEAGIPVVSLSNIINDENSYAVRSDPVMEGEIMGTYVASLLDSGEIQSGAKMFIMRAPDGSATGNSRSEGIMNTLFNVRTDCELVEEKPADWDRAKATALMEDWLTANDQIDAVLCHNDAMALGALEAIEAAGRIDEIKVFGIDGLPEAIYSISQGKMAGSVIQDAVKQAEVSLDFVHSLLVDGETPADRQVFVEGEVISLGNDNVDKWIEIMKEANNWDY